jgi:hypothetical protein
MGTEEQTPPADEQASLLAELAVEVEADLELIAKSKFDAVDPGPPGQWLADPEEVQVEKTDLRSLQGAVENLQGDDRENDQ